MTGHIFVIRGDPMETATDGRLLPVARNRDVLQSWWQPELVGPLLQDLWQGEIDWICLDGDDVGPTVAAAAPPAPMRDLEVRAHLAGGEGGAVAEAARRLEIFLGHLAFRARSGVEGRADSRTRSPRGAVRLGGWLSCHDSLDTCPGTPRFPQSVDTWFPARCLPAVSLVEEGR